MSVPSLVAIYDIDAFEGVALDLGFTLEITNEDGSSQDPPVYKDLTTKNVVLIVDDIFPDQLVLTSDDGANANNSILTKNIDPTTGQFQFHLSTEDMLTVRHTIGYAHVLLRETGADDEIMFRGTFRVIPFNAEGEL